MLSQDEIDNLLSSLSAGSGKPEAKPGSDGLSVEADPDSGGSQSLEDILQAERQKNYKRYNFKRPDKFSKEHLRALQTIHEVFARQLGLLLTAYLRMATEIEVVSVDQLTYDEFIKSMPRPITVGIVEFSPLPGQLLFGMGFEITMSMIERMLGGMGGGDAKPREMTDIEISLVKRMLDRILGVLEESWRSVMDIAVQLKGLEESYTLIQITTPGEIVALVTLELTLNGKDSGLLSLCIPYPVVEEVLNQLSSQHIFHRQQEHYPQEQETILTRMNFARIPIQVLLGGGSLTVREMLHLEVEDVIQLERGATDELLVCVNQEPKFFCRPGTVKDQVAVRITQPVKQIEALQGFGLASSRDEEERFLAMGAEAS